MLRALPLALIACTIAPTASAQDLDETLRAAEAALAAGDSSEALRLASEARAMDDGPRALALYARAEEAIDPRAAFRLYRRALGDHPDRATRVAIASGMRRARARFAVVRVEPPHAGSRVEVDGATAEWESGSRLLLLPPGAHRVSAGSVERVLELRPGDRVELDLGGSRAPGPQPLHAEGPWLAGNLVMGGAGAIGVIAASAWSLDRGAQGVEHDYAQLELGVSYGMLMASLAHLMAGAVLHIEWRPAPLALQLGTVGALFLAAVGVGAAAALGALDQSDALVATGAILGFASVTAGNLFFGVPRWDTSAGLGLAGVVRALIEAGASGALIAMREDRARACSEPVDAQLCAELPAVDALMIGSLVTAFGLGCVSAAVFAVSPGGDWLFGGGLRELHASVGPSGVNVRGRF